LQKYTSSIYHNTRKAPVSIPSVSGSSKIKATATNYRSATMNLTKLALFASLTLSPAAIFAQTPTPGQND
jgi:hypothetical protein